MPISDNFFAIENELIDRYGKAWIDLPDNHPMIIALRRSMSVKKDPPKNIKPIKAYDKGEYIGTFDSIQDCAEELQVNRDAIGRQLTGITRKVARRYTFKYVERDDHGEFIY